MTECEQLRARVVELEELLRQSQAETAWSQRRAQLLQESAVRAFRYANGAQRGKPPVPLVDFTE